MSKLSQTGQVLTGWGRTNPSRATVTGPADVGQLQEIIAAQPARGLLARGAGRSYGDAAQNAGGYVLDPVTRPRIELDPQAATVWASASTTFTQLLLSSIAAVRPRRANFVYGASKAGLDAFARGLADALHASGVRVLLVRPGFVIGRMTGGMSPAPLATTPGEVGQAVAAALGRDSLTVWVPRSLPIVAAALRLIPRPACCRLRR